ncbi:MAG: DNA cytosine methyltransferase [Lentisphaerae bacterium]|nr:DNA cytosine methyltransferase [Lentisphaerota bacterium]
MTIAEALADLEGVDDETVPNQSQFFVSSKATSGGGQGDHKNDPDKVSYCIRANARGRIQFHHRLDRRLTVRECARLQTFPDEFVFPFTTQRNLTLIGNAVPPVLGYSVAKSVLAYLDALENGAESTASVEPQRSFALQQELFA